MGYEYADTQNSAVRCFLNQFSKNFNYFDKNYKKATLEYFNYECPYSGIKLNAKNITQDHIVLFNKEACGLHVYGNVLLVTKEANSKKSSQSLEYFLRNEPERLLKIQEFIKRTGYEEIHKEYNQELKKFVQIYIKKLEPQLEELIMILLYKNKLKRILKQYYYQQIQKYAKLL